MFYRGALQVKKVLLLLITILCLVSCRTATVSSPLEIEIVPSSSSTNVESSEVQETVQPPALIDEPIIEPILNDEVPAQITGLFEPGTDVEPKIETSSEVAEENANTINSDEIIEDDKEILSEQEDLSETISQEESISDVSESLNAPSNEEMQKAVTTEVTTVVSAKEDKNSLIDKLISLFLKEKLFWFGVFTMFVGIVMLIIVFIRDMINACRRRSKKNEKKMSAKKRECKSEKSQDVSSEEKQEELNSSNTSFDDDEAFLRSLLNT